MSTKETMPQPKPLALIAYHDNCIDGFTSAWVTTRALQKLGYKNAILAMNYDKASIAKMFAALKKYEFEKLVIVDFSLKFKVIAALECQHPKLNLLILDHHKTAFEEYAPNMEVKKDSKLCIPINIGSIVLDNNESGASLCWRHFNSKENEPILVSYVRDYDLWRFDLGLETKWVNKYLKMENKTLARWDEITNRFEHPETFNLILDVGKQLQEEHDKTVEEIAAGSKYVKLVNLTGDFVKCPYEFTSDVGHALANKTGSYGLMYDWKNGDKDVKFSLRSNGDYDVTVIAKYFGGGGHKNAAGFTIDLELAEVLIGFSL